MCVSECYLCHDFGQSGESCISATACEHPVLVLYAKRRREQCPGPRCSLWMLLFSIRLALLNSGIRARASSLVWQEFCGSSEAYPPTGTLCSLAYAARRRILRLALFKNH